MTSDELRQAVIEFVEKKTHEMIENDFMDDDMTDMAVYTLHQWDPDLQRLGITKSILRGRLAMLEHWKSTACPVQLEFMFFAGDYLMRDVVIVGRGKPPPKRSGPYYNLLYYPAGESLGFDADLQQQVRAYADRTPPMVFVAYTSGDDDRPDEGHVMSLNMEGVSVERINDHDDERTIIRQVIEHAKDVTRLEEKSIPIKDILIFGRDHVIENKGNGNCFFYSILDQLDHDHPWRGRGHEELRLAIVDYALKRLDRLPDMTYALTKKVIKERLEESKTPGYSVGHDIAAFAANFLRRDLVVVAKRNPNADWYDWILYYPSGNGTEPDDAERWAIADEASRHSPLYILFDTRPKQAGDDLDNIIGHYRAIRMDN